MARKLYCFRLIHKDQPQPGQTASGFAESWWLAPNPPWYGHPEAHAELGPFHPFADAWKDDGTKYDVEQVDLEDVADEVLASIEDPNSNTMELLKQRFEVAAHPANLGRKVLSQAEAVAAKDRSQGTILTKLRVKA
jgi:hypothetical protein